VQALAAGAQREAAVRFAQAIEALERLPASPERKAEAIDLRIDLRHALIPLGAYDTIAAHLTVAQGIATEIGDRARLGRVLALLANCHFHRSEYAQGREMCAQAQLIARELGDAALEATVVMFLGMLCHQTGDYAAGAAHYRRFLREANEGVVGERVGISGLTLIYARAYLCICLAELGQFAEGYAIAEEAIRRADALRHPWALGHASIAMSCLATRQGRPERALACYAWYRDALPAAADLWPLADAWAAYAEVVAGRAEQALPRLDPATAAPLVVPALQLWRADACLQLGRLREARALASEALDIGRARGEISYEAWALLGLGEIASKSASHAAEAEGRFGEALGIARKCGLRPLEAVALLGLGRAHALEGRRDASQEIETARALLTELGMTRWLQVTETSGR
jgi:tetratricopeptide (TPR) repeat protein